jgi:hypothetical protein
LFLFLDASPVCASAPQLLLLLLLLLLLVTHDDRGGERPLSTAPRARVAALRPQHFQRLTVSPIKAASAASLLPPTAVTL